MGCCHSSPDNESPPAQPEPVPNAPRAAAADGSDSGSSSNSRRASHDGAHRAKGIDRPNKKIRTPSPLRSSPTHVPRLRPPWTRAQLEVERAAFFETRVTGQLEVWNALRIVSEMLQNDDVFEAQAILDAVNVTCPNGRVAVGRGRDRARGGVYDERGELYEVPAWVVTDPEDLIDAGEKSVDDDDDEEDAQVSVLDRRREEKGKGRAADLGEIIQLRARLSDRSTDIIVTVGNKEKVANIVRMIQEQIGNKRVRLVYLGHVLQEMQALDAQNYKTGDVINAYVFEGSEDFFKSK